MFRIWLVIEQGKSCAKLSTKGMTAVFKSASYYESNLPFDMAFRGLALELATQCKFAFKI